MPFCRWSTTGRVIGLLLILSAALKAFDLAAGPLPGDSALEEPWFRLFGVGCEVVWATWLLFGGGGTATWLLTVLMWIAFAGFNAYGMVVGKTTCGCFGVVKVSPRVTLTIDMIALGFTMLSKPRPGSDSGRLVRGGVISVAAAMVASTAFGVWNFNRFADLRLSQDGLLRSGSAIIIDPTSWPGKQFPLLGQTNIGATLTKGRWLVLLYRADCDHCNRAIPRYAEWISELGLGSDGMQLAFVEIPPYSEGQIEPLKPAVYGRLSAGNDWVVGTPMAVTLVDGKVTNVVEGEAAEFPPGLAGTSEAVVR